MKLVLSVFLVAIFTLLVWIANPSSVQCYQETTPSESLSSEELSSLLWQINHAMIYDSKGKVIKIITVGKNGSESKVKDIALKPETRKSTSIDSMSDNTIKEKSTSGMHRSPNAKKAEGMDPAHSQKLDGTMSPWDSGRRPTAMSTSQQFKKDSMMMNTDVMPANDMSQISGNN